MGEILQKLSSYNIFNYLLPGIVFVVLLKWCANINLIVDEVLLGMFLYYFVGMVISRIGSILIEPLLRCTKIIQFSDYPRFVRASKLDNKIELLSEVNNTYRTIISMIIVLIVVLICIKSAACHLMIALGGSLLLFVLSYRKQTSFITQRVDEALRGVS
ncbi:hypothetical protein HQ46_00065 [Porphyromonas gulae]|nr:hypothetical protein HQ46_00065 [Porphyromonas gulae]KKC51494.1 hypothetical protein HR10_03245 [Porphyromonas gulae]